MIRRPSFIISRRSFLKRCSALAAATGLPAWFLEPVLAAAEARRPKVAANDRPGVALIGCGGQGKQDTTNAAAFADVVAVCDVNAGRMKEASERFTVDGKVPAIVGDFRRVLERDDVHAIINATPDHWHTLINLAAAKARKDVYSEKPLSLTIDEGRRVVRAVRESGIVLQTGTQQRSMHRFRLTCELVRNGRIGKLERIEVWLPAGIRGGPFATAPVPAGLDWDFWLGQAPKHDYVPERQRASFRWWYDYSGGVMTDWGAHHNDIASWAIGLPGPREIEGRPLAEPIPGGYTAHNEYDVHFTYANGVQIHLRTTKDDGTAGQVLNRDGQRNGLRFVGSDGWIFVNREQFKASEPELLKQPLPDEALKLYLSSDHAGNFFDCMRSRNTPICDAETGHRSATLCHLGVIAVRTGAKLTWDAAREQFVGENASLANRFLSREMRAPYDYTFVA